MTFQPPTWIVEDSDDTVMKCRSTLLDKETSRGIFETCPRTQRSSRPPIPTLGDNIGRTVR
jgi:hypothetical protein